MQTQTIQQTNTTLGNYLQTLAGTRNLETFLAEYDDNAVFYTPDCVYKGIEEIRSFFNGFLKDIPPEMCNTFEVMWQEAAEDSAHIVWKADPFIPLGTDTFVMRNGKITLQTFSMHFVS